VARSAQNQLRIKLETQRTLTWIAEDNVINGPVDVALGKGTEELNR
jgi:hypothetical protein